VSKKYILFWSAPIDYLLGLLGQGEMVENQSKVTHLTPLKYPAIVKAI
jgi:hypothetical protein